MESRPLATSARNGQQDTARGNLGLEQTRKGIVEKPMAAGRRSMDRSRGLASRLFAAASLGSCGTLSGGLFGNGGWSLEHRACRNHGQLYLRTCFRQEGETWFRTRFPAEPTETLAHAFSLRPSRPAIQRLLISFALRRRMARSRSWSFLFTGERTTRPSPRAREGAQSTDFQRS